jgi:sphinganine-1-phosphate aldolase
VILYRNAELRSYQFYALADWPGGIYASPTVAGSRSGYLIACCWATLMYYGFDGYVEETRKIIQIARDIADGYSDKILICFFVLIAL